MPLANIDKLNHMAAARGNPFRVLVVDDEKWVQDIFRDFFELTEAFDVDIADTGEEAIRKVSSNRYDLITLDLIMPEISGLDVLATIKEITPHVPVMIVTGNATEKIVNQAGLLGACSVLYKPLMLENFISELMATLSR
ncbi:MAG: response regulator [Candidatus Zixiibacteriota bacterium]|nr:MAG: response regulator [candidate division Zixibacteria bacterium]